MPYKNKESRKKYYLANKKRLSIYSKKRYLKNKDKIKTQIKKRYLEKREEILAYFRKRYLKNKTRIKEINKKWASKNKEKIKAIKKRYRIKNKEKIRKDGRKYYRKHKKQYYQYRKKWRKNNPQKIKEEKLRLKFKMSIEDYNNLLKNQNNRCGICNEKFDLKNYNKPNYPNVDHCHKTGKIRGILCSRCNSGLGSFHDDQSVLDSAVLWLKNKIVPIGGKFVKQIDISRKKELNLKRKYNLTFDQLKGFFSTQDYKCGICKKDLLKTNIKGKGLSSFNIDHCHVTGKIRGILCPLCNRALGLFKDDPRIISNAIKWIERTKNENN